MSCPISIRSALAVTAVAAGVTLTSSALATDPITGFWDGPDAYAYSVQWMPDIDQRWFFLPNDGSMYCIPTACMNMLAFAAHWGDDLLSPGPGVWEDDSIPEQYDLADRIELLGELMGTSPTSGTGLTGLFTGLDLWVGPRPFDVWVQGRTEDDYPTLSDATANGTVSGGAPVALCYGRYQWDTQGGATPRLVDREGGHMVTLQQTTNLNGVETLFVRNPSSSDTMISQSPYAIRVFGNVLTQTVRTDENEDGTYSPTTATTLGTTGDGRLRVLDSMATIVPCFAGGFRGGSVAFEVVGGIAAFGDDDGPGIQEIALPEGAEPLDLAIQGGERTAIVLYREADGRSAIARASADNTSAPLEIIGRFDDPDLAHVEIDRHGRMLLVSGQTLLELTEEGKVSSLDALLIINHLGGPIVVDDANDRILIVEADGRQATIVDFTVPDQPMATALLLPAVQSAREAARRSGAPAAADDRFFVVDQTTAGDRIVAVTIPVDGAPSSTQVVPAETGRTFDGLSVDRRGHLVASVVGGGVKVFAESPAGFLPIDDDWYDEAAALDGLALSRSRTNTLPGLHDGPGWENIDPAELEPGESILDCYADIDRDGEIGLGDLLRVLAGWGGDGEADIMPRPGGDGVTDFADLLVVLTAWGPCD